MTATVSASDSRTTPAEAKRPVRARWTRFPWVILAVALGLFVYGETTIPSAVASQFGLLAVASPAYVISILLSALGFAIAVRHGNFRAAAAATALMIVVQRLPRTIATDLPMYAWTYKHLGVVDYIRHSHKLARDVDVYNCWPSLFAVTAWFSELTGVPPLTIAHWYTPVFHVLFAAMAYGVARAWSLPPLIAVTATFLVVNLNWVEQDYYSPQATVIILAAAIFALVGLSKDRAVSTLLIIVLFAAATITHQLTPYWIALAIGLLVVTRKMKPWWIIFPLAVILLSFLLYNWDQAAHYELFSGNPIKNAESNVPTEGVLGQRITSAGVRTLSASMWLTTVVILLIRWRRKQPFWALGVLALSPMLILGGQSYGGEAIFRVFLYSVVGCSLVLAPALVSALSGSLKRYVAGVLVVLTATVLSAQGYTGGWYANVIPKEQFDTSRLVMAQAELPAYLTSVAPVWPERVTWKYVDYARFKRDYDYPMTYAAHLALRDFASDEDYAEFLKALQSRPDASTYLIFTEQMQVYAWYFGILPWDALPNLKAHMFNDPENWQPLFNGQGITVFLHKVNPYDGQDGPSLGSAAGGR